VHLKCQQQSDCSSSHIYVSYVATGDGWDLDIRSQPYYAYLKTVGQVRLGLLGLNLLVVSSFLELKVALCLGDLDVVNVPCSKTLFFSQSFLSSDDTHSQTLAILTENCCNSHHESSSVQRFTQSVTNSYLQTTLTGHVVTSPVNATSSTKSDSKLQYQHTHYTYHTSLNVYLVTLV